VYWQDGAVVLETNTAENNENGNYTEFYLDPKTDSVEAVIGLSSRTNLPPTNDTGAEIQVRATFFNDTQDYGFNGQDGDFEASVKISLGSDGRRRFRANLRRRDVDGRSGDDLLSDNQELEDGLLSLVPELDKDYRIMLRIDRENQVLTFGIDDNTFDYQIPTGVFLPNQRRAIISVNQWGPSGIAVGRIVSIKTNTFAEDFSQSAPVLAPYRPNFSAQHPGRVVEVVDGRLRLEADGALSSGRDPRLVALSASDYVGADIELSSESTLLADGEVLVEVSGTFYNDLPAEARDPETPNIGNVFAKVSVIREGDNSMHAQYCAFRVNDQNFDSLTELLGGDEKNCPQFMDLPALDTAYPAFVKFDRQAATLTFGFNGAEVVYNITTTMSATRPFNGVKASTSDGSKVVAWVDDLAFSENAVPLSMSESQLVFDASAQPSEPAGSGNGSGNGGGDGERPLNDGTNSTGGSGCSVGVRSGGFDPTLLFMFFLAMLICGNRMRRKI